MRQNKLADRAHHVVFRAIRRGILEHPSNVPCRWPGCGLIGFSEYHQSGAIAGPCVSWLCVAGITGDGNNSRLRGGHRKLSGCQSDASMMREPFGRPIRAMPWPVYPGTMTAEGFPHDFY